MTTDYTDDTDLFKTTDFSDYTDWLRVIYPKIRLIRKIRCLLFCEICAICGQNSTCETEILVVYSY